MRAALLSAVETGKDGRLRAFFPLGGRVLIEWQADIARDWAQGQEQGQEAGCETFFILTDAPSQEHDALRRSIERRGGTCHFVHGPGDLVGKLAADDLLCVIADGVIFDREEIRDRLAGRVGVAAVPASEGVAAGLERIDATRAFAGMMVCRGQVVDGLADFPSDSAAIPLLLRLALQARAPIIELGGGWIESGSLLVAHSARDIETRERRLIERAGRATSALGPSGRVAAHVARLLSPLALRRSEAGGAARPEAFALAGGLLLLGGAAYAAIIGWGSLALALLTAWLFGLDLVQSLRQIRARLKGERLVAGEGTTGFLADFALGVMLMLVLADQGWLDRLFLPAALIAMLRIVRFPVSPIELAARDRVLVAALLSLAALEGVLAEVIKGLILLALGFTLVATSRRTGDQGEETGRKITRA